MRLVQTSLSALRGRRRRVVLGIGLPLALLAALGVWGWNRAAPTPGGTPSCARSRGLTAPPRRASRVKATRAWFRRALAAARESSEGDAGLRPAGSAAAHESGEGYAGVVSLGSAESTAVARPDPSATDAAPRPIAAVESGKSAAESRRVLPSPVTSLVRSERTHAGVKKTRVSEPAPEPGAGGGEGELRIGSSPTVQVRVAGKSRGETPLILTLPAGAHTVELVPKRGKKAVCRVHVVADWKTRLVYDFSDERCELTSL